MAAQFLAVEDVGPTGLALAGQGVENRIQFRAR